MQKNGTSLTCSLSLSVFGQQQVKVGDVVDAVHGGKMPTEGMERWVGV
jgi:hypothetical protein